MSQITLEDNQVAEATMTAVIVYNHSFSAIKAKAMLERASHRADASLHWTVKPIHLDLLTRHMTAESAMNIAADAHLMLIALRHPLRIPSRLRDWLENWALHRHIQDAALAVWNGVNGDTLSPAAVPDLSRFAARHSLSFISDFPAPADTEPESNRREREEFSAPTLQHMLEQALGPLYKEAALHA